MAIQHQAARISKDDMAKIMKNNAPKEPEKKKISAKKIIFVLFEIILIIGYAVVLLCGRFISSLKDTEFYQSFDIISKPADPIHVVRLLSYALLVISLSIILRFVFRSLSKNKKVTKKTGVAILQLFSNLIKYVTYIVIICIILNAIGVDTAGIFAGLGIIALIIGLGVTSLIEDIVAGIFIIAERLFDVDDIIVLDGFRGTVVSIGIRSTKIADVGGDILTVRNSSIGSIINLTDRLSCVAITMPIAPEEPIDRVEAVIKNANIEQIKNLSPKIKNNPIYLGICGITKKGVQQLLFIAPCLEADRYDVERILYHELKLIFDANNVKLGAPTIDLEDE
ncbi:MAG: mechanosensitive ion channel [Clostridia bacterium]|nr:mechanosensitive ion channel [Clostridia bacterium]